MTTAWQRNQRPPPPPRIRIWRSTSLPGRVVSLCRPDTHIPKAHPAHPSCHLGPFYFDRSYNPYAPPNPSEFAENAHYDFLDQAIHVTYPCLHIPGDSARPRAIDAAKPPPSSDTKQTEVGEDRGTLAEAEHQNSPSDVKEARSCARDGWDPRNRQGQEIGLFLTPEETAHRDPAM